MQTAVSSLTTLLDLVDAHAATRVARERDDFESAHRCRSRIGPVGGIRHDDLVAAHLTAMLEILLRDQQRAQLGVSAGRRVERKRGHAEKRAERALEFVHYLERALGEFVGRKRMQLGELAPRDDRIVYARVVLHRARAQRVEAEVDSERSMRELRIVADDVELAVVRQREIVAHDRFGQKGFERLSALEIMVGASLLTELEDQRDCFRRRPGHATPPSAPSRPPRYRRSSSFRWRS